MWYNQYFGQMPVDGSKLSKKKLAQMQNNIEFINTFSDIFTTAQHEIGIEGLPETCDERFIIRSALLYGKMMLAKHNGNIISPAPAGGPGITMYGYRAEYWGWGLNGFNQKFTAFVPGSGDEVWTSDGKTYSTEKPEAVIGFDNPDAFPYVNHIFNAAKRMADIMRACDVAIQNLKMPAIAAADETQKKSIEEAFRQREDNEITIIFSKLSVAADNFKLFDLNVKPEVLVAFWQQYRNIENQCYERLGINNNADTDKKERLLVAEVTANNDRTEVNFQKRMKCWETWADNANRILGTSLRIVDRRGQDELNDVDGMEGGESDSTTLSDDARRRDAGGDN